MIRTDCRHFLADRPCRYHKTDGYTCSHCPRYSPFTSRIWIVKLGAMGDVLRTTFLLKGIRERHPDAHITWVTRKESVSFFAGIDTVDRVITPEAAMWFTGVEYIHTVYGLELDAVAAAIVTQTNAEKVYGFSLYEDGYPVAHCENAAKWQQLSYRDDLKRANHTTYQQQFTEIVELDDRHANDEYSYVISDDEREWIREQRNLWTERGFNGPYIGINLGGNTRWRQKLVTMETIKGVIKQITADGSPTGSVVLLGGADAVEAMESLSSEDFPGIIVTATDSPLRDFASLVAACDVLYTADTLAMHLAIATKTHCVVNFGPTSPYEIEFYGRGEAIVPDLDCLVCYHSHCPLEKQCTQIDPKTVLEAIQRQLQLRLENNS